MGKIHKYVSRKKELCIVVRPQDRTIDEQRRVKIVPGKRVEFFAGKYQTDDPEVIECLANHPYKNNKFFELTEKDEEIVKAAAKIAPPAVPVMDGPVTTEYVAPSERDVATRPEDKALPTNDLIAIIDERINKALGTVIELLQKDTKKEEAKVEAIKTETPRKVFRCPYCAVQLKSGFEVGSHKKVCVKRPK